MRILKAILILSLVASLSGCVEEPQVLDGPGMVYVDSEYRTGYANAIPYEENACMCAAAFLGYGDNGEKNADAYIENCFSELSQEQRDAIEQILCDGNEWYLVVPRYADSDTLVESIDEKGNVTGEIGEVPPGIPFLIRCNKSGEQSNIRLSGLSRGRRFSFSLQADKDGNIIKDKYMYNDSCFLMDITEELNKIKKSNS